MKFCVKTFETCSLLYTSLYLNARFSSYFVQLLIVRSKCQGGKDGPGRAKKNSKGGQLPPPAPILPAPMCSGTLTYKNVILFGTATRIIFD